MDVDPLTNIKPSDLAELKQSSSGRFDFLPTLWDAVNALISPELESRLLGVQRLEETDAIRHHPLVSNLFFMSITEPDIELRARVVKALSSVVFPNQEGNLASETVRLHLNNCLSGMRTRQIFALLQVADFDPNSEPMVAGLLSYCSFAGKHLSDILANRQTPLSIRKRAAHFIGRIGFLDALPCLERLEARLESRKNGKQSLIDEKVDESDEFSLLPLLKDALSLLRAP